MQQRSNRPRNLRDGESTARRIQWSLILGGAALGLYGLTGKKHSKVALATAGVLAYQGAKLKTEPVRFHGKASFIINCAPEEAFGFWRNFENLPLFMRHLESVKVTSATESEWVAIGPLETSLRWKAEIVNERQNELLAWQSMPGSDFNNSGSVRFHPAPGNRGTMVQAVLNYEPPGGPLGRAVAAMLGKDPSFTLREDLRRFKALFEAGDIPTTEGQSHGPRSGLMNKVHAVFPEKRKPSEFRVGAQMAERRAS